MYSYNTNQYVDRTIEVLVDAEPESVLAALIQLADTKFDQILGGIQEVSENTFLKMCEFTTPADVHESRIQHMAITGIMNRLREHAKAAKQGTWPHGVNGFMPETPKESEPTNQPATIEIAPH